jgi:hypothetical protein
MEDKMVTISRGKGSLNFSANFHIEVSRMDYEKLSAGPQ